MRSKYNISPPIDTMYIINYYLIFIDNTSQLVSENNIIHYNYSKGDTIQFYKIKCYENN